MVCFVARKSFSGTICCDMARAQCTYCLEPLDDRPCIILESKPYCYLHAKSTIKILKLRYEESQRRYLDEMERYKKELGAWNDRKETESKTAVTWDGGDTVWLTGILGVIGWVSIPHVGFILGGIVGIFVGLAVKEKQQKRFGQLFDSKYPKPTTPCTEQPKRFDESSLVLDKKWPRTSLNNRDIRTSILTRDRHICQSCGRHYGKELLEVHHVQPQADDGPDHPANLVTLCLECHDRETWFGHRRMYPTTL